MPYLLDANVFIQAKNLHYGFDFCPAFWDWLLAARAAGSVFSIDRVAHEINAGSDELTAWARDHAELFLETDAAALAALGAVSNWASSQSYEPAAINTFFQVADYFLVAHALARGWVLVTHETAAPSAKKIKIPNACVGLGVTFMTPYEMLRVEQARFVLGS